jgi:hypothetical protein
MEPSSKTRIRAAVSDWDWAAIAAGVVVALAIQILLLWLGNAFVLSFGDQHASGGFAVWVVFVQLGSLFLGAGFAAYLARASTMVSGAATGAFTWALALVLGTTLARQPLETWAPNNAGAAAWTTFFGGLLSLATAMIGGAIGGRRSHATPLETPITDEPTTRPRDALV